MNYYKDLRLDELDIASAEEAQKLEFELDLRFEEFTPDDRRTWLKQNAYLDQFSRMGTVTSAASKAGVTVYTAQRWKNDNVLGFSRRLEVAALTFNDRLEQIALQRASDPKAPATLLIELLRANIPKKFSVDDHKGDKRNQLEQLSRYREKARREKEAGYSTLMRIARGDPDPFRKDLDSEPSELRTPQVVNPPYRFVDESRNPAEVSSDPIELDQTRNVSPSPSPTGGLDHDDHVPLDTGREETQREAPSRRTPSAPAPTEKGTKE